MLQTDVTRTIATRNLSGCMRKPTYLDELFPEDTFSNCLVFRDDESLALVQSVYGSDASAFGLRFDVLSIHATTTTTSTTS